MSGVAGGTRIKLEDVDRTFTSFYNNVLKQIPGFRKANLSGSTKAKSKEDYGDLDIIAQFDGQDKKEVKQRIIDFITKQSDRVIIPFKSPKYTGRKYYNAGELISVLFPIEGKEGGEIQVDVIIALDPAEQEFKTSFLDLPAEKQGLIIGLAKVILLEKPVLKVFKELGITNVPTPGENQEYEFNLSSNKLTLRLVTLDNYKETNREDIWSTTDWSTIGKLFKGFKLDGNFEQLLNSINSKVKDPRSKRRIAGVFKSMVSVKSGEEGTPKGDNKIKAIQQVDQVLSEVANQETVGLYAGGFKPPHRGHFKIATELAKVVDRLVIFIGSTIRPGEPITVNQSTEIWKIYGKYLGIPVEIVQAPVTPVRSLYEWVDENIDQLGKILVGINSDDPKDPGKYSYFNKHPDKYSKVHLLPVKALIGKEDQKLSGTDIRSNIDYLESLDWTPDQLNSSDRRQILKSLKNTVNELRIQNRMIENVDSVMENMFKKSKKQTQEGSSGTPIAPTSAQPSKDRNKLVQLYNHLRNVLYEPDWNIEFQQDRVVITKKDPARISYDYTPYMASILDHMLQEGMKILPLPEIKIRRDIAESADFFGKTAYYDPNLKEVVLYVEGRHPKDVMRSFVHEMIHHIQNLEGRLTGIDTVNTNEDQNLNEIEQEAYLKGNITFRNWEDKVKNNG
jgi:hypothetical protein